MGAQLGVPATERGRSLSGLAKALMRPGGLLDQIETALRRALAVRPDDVPTLVRLRVVLLPQARRFSGGDLLLHDTDREAGRYDVGAFTRIGSPRHLTRRA